MNSDKKHCLDDLEPVDFSRYPENPLATEEDILKSLGTCPEDEASAIAWAQRFLMVLG